MVGGSFRFVPNKAVTFNNGPCGTPLGLRTGCAIGNIPLDSLDVNHSFDDGGVQMSYLVGVANAPRSPDMSFSVSLPAIGASTGRVVCSIVGSRRRVGRRMLCLLTVKQFCTRAGGGRDDRSTSRRDRASLTVRDFLDNAVSRRLGAMLSGIMGDGG